WNPLAETWRILRFTAGNRTVFLSVLGVSWFWFYGAALVTQFPNLARHVLAASEEVVTLLLVVFSIGVGAGSLLCQPLSGHKVELGLVPFGSIGLTLFGIDFAFAASAPEPSYWRMLPDIALIGVFGGFYIVPLYALVQSRSEAKHRSRIIAGNNVLNAVFMVVAAAFAVGLFAVGLTIPQFFLAVAVMNAAVALYIYKLVPEFLMRFMVWILIHSVYRLEKAGLEKVPE